MTDGLNQKVEQARGAYAQARSLMDQGSYEEAMPYLDQVLNLGMELKDGRTVGTSLNDFGFVFLKLGQPETALEYYDRALKVRRAARDRHGEALTLSNAGDAHLALGQLDQGRQLWEQALDGFREVGDEERAGGAVAVLQALRSAAAQPAAAEPAPAEPAPTEPVTATRDELRDRFALSQRLLQEGAVGEALDQLWVVLEIARRLGDRDFEALTLAGIGGVQSESGRLEEATQTLEQAVALNNELGNAEREASSLHLLADACRDKGDREAAAQHLERVIAMPSLQADPEERANTLQKLGVICSELGRVEESLTHGEAALRLYRQLRDRAREGQLLHNLGVQCAGSGRFEDALQHFEDGLRIGREEKRPFDVATALEGLGMLHSRFGRSQEALRHFEEALSIRREMGDRALEGRALTNVAVIQEELGRQDEAIDTLRDALEIARSEGDLEGERTASNNAGAMFRQAGQPENARPYFERALQLSRQLGRADTYGQMLNNLGAVHLDLEENDHAIAHFEEAIRLAGQMGDRHLESQALGNLARVHRLLGNSQTALDRFEQAVKVIEDLRGEVVGEELRTSFFATVQEIYDDYSSLLVEQHREEEGFHMAERGKARAFLDLLAEAQAEVREGADPELQAKQQRLLAELSDLRERLVLARSAGDAGAIADLTHQTEERTQELHAVEARLRAENPRYAALTQLTAWEVAKIQEKLVDEDTALLEYVLADRGSLLFCVLTDGFEVFSLPPRDEIEQKVRELRAAVLHGLHAYPHGHELYETLVAPAAHLIEGKDLLICADGALHYLPFSLLLTDEPGGEESPGDRIDPGPQRSAVADSEPELTARVEAALAGRPAFDYATLPFLVHRHAISYAPSATVAGLVRADAEARERSYDGDLAGFADPRGLAGAEEGEVALGAALAHTRDRLEPLPLTADEVWTIAELVSPGGLPTDRPDRYDDGRVSVRTATAATKEEIAALTSGRRRFRFFHIASHGLLDAEKPQYSGLVLSPTNSGAPFWRTFEIFNARIPSELVVLSACETGLGKIVSGEGIVGLTRAFLYAGAPTVCVSLWKVADESSPPLMRSFYEAILAGESKGRALQTAQREMLDHGLYAHPYWWAPFVVVGEARMRGGRE